MGLPNKEVGIKINEENEKMEINFFSLRNFPVPLHRALKIWAATEGNTLGKLVIEVLEQAAKKAGYLAG